MTEAILLVGGQGTRLRPLTITTPKPLLPVAGVPVTVHQIERARDALAWSGIAILIRRCPVVPSDSDGFIRSHKRSRN